MNDLLDITTAPSASKLTPPSSPPEVPEVPEVLNLSEPSEAPEVPDPNAALSPAESSRSNTETNKDALILDYDQSQTDLPDLHDALIPDGDWKDSESAYNRIAHKIVDISGEQLESQNESKIKLKEKLSAFFRAFLIVQFVVLSLLLAGQMVCKILWPDITTISDQVIITYITSVFVETLGGIIMMIAYAFNSKDEVQITQILSDVIKNFQKKPPSDQ